MKTILVTQNNKVIHAVLTTQERRLRQQRKQEQKQAWGYGWVDRAAPHIIYSCHPGYNSLAEIWQDTVGLGNFQIIEIASERVIYTASGSIGLRRNY